LAHSKSAKKRIRQSEVKRLHNRSMKSALRTAMKKFAAAVAAGNTDLLAAAYKEVQKSIDKTASKGIIRKGTADRMKSRLSSKIAAKPAAKK